MRTGLVLATCVSTFVIVARCASYWGSWRSSWKSSIAGATATHCVIRPVLGLALAGLADVLDPSQDFGIRHDA